MRIFFLKLMVVFFYSQRRNLDNSASPHIAPGLANYCCSSSLGGPCLEGPPQTAWLQSGPLSFAGLGCRGSLVQNENQTALGWSPQKHGD